MNIDDMFPSKYLRGSDLEEPITVTIARLTQVPMRPYKGADPVQKWVLHLEEIVKAVILCSTTARQIAKAVGSKTVDDWIGHRITLFPKPLKVAGKNRIAIRARAPAVSNGTPSANLQADDEDFTADQLAEQDAKSQFYALASPAVAENRIGGGQLNTIIQDNKDNWPAAVAELKKVLGEK